MKTQDVDDGMIAAKEYADKLEKDFDEHFYADRPPPPTPSLDNYGAQIAVLRTVLQGMQSQQPPQPPVVQ